MILAAGYGSRLRPLTETLPKPLVPICNQPLLAYIIAHIRAAGIRDIVINLHYRGEQIRQWLGSGEQLGVAVTYSEEPEMLGSAGGIRHVRSSFASEPALVIHGDLLFDIDLRAVIQYHLSRQADATLVLHSAHHRYRYGIIKVNPQGEIAQFVDQSVPWIAGPFIDTVFTGVQVLAPGVLDTIQAEPVTVLTTDVYPRLLSRTKRLYGYLMRGYWSDIGTPSRYWEANLDLLQGRVDPAAPIRQGEARHANSQHPGRTCNYQIQPPVALHESVHIEQDAIIGPEVAVGAECEIAEGSHLRQSILWPRVRIGRQATIERAIITSDIDIPAGSHVVDKIVSRSGVTDL